MAGLSLTGHRIEVFFPQGVRERKERRDAYASAAFPGLGRCAPTFSTAMFTLFDIQDLCCDEVRLREFHGKYGVLRAVIIPMARQTQLCHIHLAYLWNPGSR